MKKTMEEKPVSKIMNGKRVNLAPFGRKWEYRIGDITFVYETVDRTHVRLLEAK